MQLWTRRVVLQRALQLGAMGVATPLAINLAAIGEAAAFDSTDYKALVCVFLYGGNDYANTVVPYDAANYALYHQIRAGAAGEDAGRHRAGARAISRATALTPLDGGQVLTDNLQYALAPQLAGLKSLFDAGRLAVQLNVGPLIQPTTLAQYQSTNQRRESAAAQAVLAQRPAIGVAVERQRRLDHRLGRAARRHRAVEQRAPIRCSPAFPRRGNAVFVAGRDALQYQISPAWRDPHQRARTAPLRDALNAHHHAQQRARARERIRRRHAALDRAWKASSTRALGGVNADDARSRRGNPLAEPAARSSRG